MPRTYVLQPNGLIGIWSSIVDDFTHLDCTAPEAIQIEMDDKMNDQYPGGKRGLRADLAESLENIARKGRAWRWAPTWDEAIEIIRDLHGDEKARERQFAIEHDLPNDTSA